MIRLLSFVIIFALCPSITSAQEPLSLSDLIRRAVDQNEQIAAFKARAEQKRLEAQQAQAQPNPEIGFSRGRKEVSPNKGPLYEFSVAQPFLFPGKQTLRAAVIEAEAEQERVRQTRAELTVALGVTRLAYEYGLARRASEIAAERQEHFETIRTYLSGRTFAAPQKMAESRIVENRLRNLVTKGLEAQAATRDAFEKLNLLIRVGTDTYPNIRLIWFNGRTALDKGAWLGRALSDNFDLAEQGLEAEGARKSADLAKIELMPDFSVSAFAQRERANETERNRGLGLGLSIPIFNRNVKGIASAKQLVAAEETTLAYQRRVVESAMKRSLAEYEAARQIASRYPESLLKQIHSQFEETEEEFRKGRVDFLTLLELDGEYAETVEHALEAQLALIESASEIFELSGEMDFLRRIESF